MIIIAIAIVVSLMMTFSIMIFSSEWDPEMEMPEWKKELMDGRVWLPKKN